jgi:hypothetical protein
MAQTGTMMFGRRTYEDLYESWAHRSDGNPFTEMMNNVQKYVASNTLTEPLPWVKGQWRSVAVACESRTGGLKHGYGGAGAG